MDVEEVALVRCSRPEGRLECEEMYPEVGRGEFLSECVELFP